LLLCNDITACLLASYIVQGIYITIPKPHQFEKWFFFYLEAEFSDYNQLFENNLNYLKGRQFFPHQNDDHIFKIMEYHKKHT
jgi:hypothetical protein